MADNRNRKQDRKVTKRLEKAIRNLKDQIARSIAIDPLVDIRDEEYNLAQMEVKLTQMLAAKAPTLNEWDDRDEDRDDKVRQDRDRKGHRKAKHSRHESDEDWAA
ncbi:hypothetical protein C4565_08345 [Candidatus Parcubacteria bacterium]|nr:MAG: hypothetical protein C4565_08345 [Candidatus Parcubacteria bacterium]